MMEQYKSSLSAIIPSFSSIKAPFNNDTLAVTFTFNIIFGNFETKTMSKKVYQIQISLLGFKPKIWRRILVQSDMLLSDFHKVIQTTMGWTNFHLHQFIKNETHYSERIPEDMAWDETGNLDYLNIKLSDLLEKEEERILYEYDFGDGWTHDLILEKILYGDNELEFPVCLSGEMNCPPEDCGGINGFANILEILKNPKDEEYESYIVWLGGKFNPAYFNIRKVNKLLRSKEYGCIELDD